jgi:hypothetical protein
MARKTKSIQYVPLEERPEFIAAVAALPDDPAELEVRAFRVRQLYHDALLAGDVQALDDADLVYRACVIKLNGGTHFGCAGIQNALEAKLAARPGQIPEWGQAGEFLLDVDGMRIVVKMCLNGLESHCGAELWAVDFDKPFVSETGFRHHYMRPPAHLGRTVDQAVRAEVLESLAGEGKARAIKPEHAAPKARKVWPWLADALAGVRADGQLAMFGDAPKDPEAKAPMSNTDRQRAFRERQRKLKEEQGIKAMLLDEEERQLIYQWREQRRVLDQEHQTGVVVPQVTLARLNVELERLRDVVQRMESEHTGLSAELYALQRECRVLEGERNKAHGAIQLWEQRLRNAGLSTDYRPQDGE